MKIYGAAYGADLHCVECTEKNFDTDIDTICDADYVDSEGNSLYFLYSWDIKTNDVCRDCFCNLLEQF